MAEKTALPKSLYAFGEGEESAQANQRYEDAYNQLIAAVEKRNQPQFFDPTLLAISQAFLGPTKTGSFGEAAGVAAGNVAKSQEAEQTRVEDLAKMRLELAGMGVERASQRGIVQNLAKKAGMAPAGTAPAGSTPSGSAPAGVAAGQPATKSPEIEEGLEPIGRFPTNPNLIRSEQDFYRRALESGQRDPVTIGKEWVEYQKNFLSPKFEGGNVYDPISGNIYSKTTGGTATTIFMTGQTAEERGSFVLPESAVREHQRLLAAAQKNPNNPEVWDRLEAFENFWRKPYTRPVKTPAVTNIPYPTEVPQPVAQVPVQPVAQVPVQPAGQAPAQPPAQTPARPAAQPPAQVPAAQPGATAAIPPPPAFSAPLRFTPVQRPPGRLSAEQKAAYDAEDKTRLDAALADQKASLDSQQAQYSAALAERKAQEDARRAEKKAIADKIRERELAREKALIEANEGATAEGKKSESKKRAEEAVAKEIEIADKANNAGRMFTAADTVIQAVTRSQNYFGLFDKPGVLAAIGSTLSEVGKPGGKFTLVDVEDKVVKLMPGTTPQNLLDRKNAASALAEIELTFTKDFMSKQGQITEGERKIVRAIPGGLSDSAKFLEIKAKLIRERAQFDMDVNLAFQEYMLTKPDGNATDFTRSSLYKGIYRDFQNNLAELGKTIPALPTKERRPDAASSYAQDLLRRRAQQ
jgi:hypothetical protein